MASLVATFTCGSRTFSSPVDIVIVYNILFHKIAFVSCDRVLLYARIKGLNWAS